MDDTNIMFMRLAIAQAEAAGALGEVPVGAIICRDGVVIAAAHNRRETEQNALAHAELLAIADACRTLESWRLEDCDLYCTLEPCPMCMGAIINARVKRVFFGASDPKAGCAGSLCDLSQLPFNHKPEMLGGVLQQECGYLLRDFFARLRHAHKGQAEES